MTRETAAQFCERLGHRAKARRLFVGLTQEQVSSLSGINVQQVRKYEAGESEPQAFTLLQLARALECSADFLLGRADTESKGAMRDNAEFLADPNVAAILRLLHKMDAKARKRAHMVLIAGEESRA